MKKITINVYSFKELSKEAQKKVLDDYRADNDMPFLSELMSETLTEQLKKHGLKSENAKTYYSLSYCQGDGAMFEGDFEWKKYSVYIKHSGHYYHSNSKTIEIQENNNLGYDVDDNIVYDKFEKIYQSICAELEKAGYAYIEAENKDENIIEEIEANEWTYEANGAMRNK